ncbi:hypothetical protein BBO99_00001708 [Phytophthora kernoviae]|uniref:Uncharacterized protein n=1 Tax=Phytophthora kernoviae TaxID=325452 RepID=A0A3R7G784_9STRA|nr:hypothetical protein JM16_001442 [Phytophthora kernoviae]KAG2532029.1 hypothetical protein JM18_001523 [Phytophthora kernoviae]RLN36755.1 hypothetical protein BBI17_001540 [Phytophthora kernoviae]RLN83901.1 hypothetical protein BBO99_00001708 [Phytophthora kernoviae]
MAKMKQSRPKPGVEQRQRARKELANASDIEEEDEELVFMSILFDRGELGVAIYNALTTSLKTLQLQVAENQELEEHSGIPFVHR